MRPAADRAVRRTVRGSRPGTLRRAVRRPGPIVVAAVVPVPVYEKVTLDADTLFDFDKSELRPAGREALDTFMKKIQGIDPSTIVAVGHTDRLGTSRYNQDLSERRVRHGEDLFSFQERNCIEQGADQRQGRKCSP